MLHHPIIKPLAKSIIMIQVQEMLPFLSRRIFPTIRPQTGRSYVPLPRALGINHQLLHILETHLTTYLEEEANNKDLQTCHGHHHQTLNNRQVEDSPLCAADGAEVAVLASAEILLVAGDGRELARKLEDRLLEGGGLFWAGALLGWEGGALFVFDLCLSIVSLSIVSCLRGSHEWCSLQQSQSPQTSLQRSTSRC